MLRPLAILSLVGLLTNCGGRGAELHANPPDAGLPGPDGGNLDGGYGHDAPSPDQPDSQDESPEQDASPYTDARPTGPGTSSYGAVKFEAENGTLSGTQVATTRKGYSGAGYVTGFDQDNDAVSIRVTVPTQGIYELKLGYASEHDDKQADVAINSEPTAQAVLKKSAVFDEQSAGKIWLRSGENVLRISKGWGWYDLDYITITGLQTVARNYDVPDLLVSPAASDETKALFRYLRSLYGKKILSGQYGAAGTEGEHVSGITGKWPVVGGFDFWRYSPSVGGKGDGTTETAIDWYKKRNGIVTFSWHWFSPSGSTGSQSFYAKDTTFDLTRALVAGTAENSALLRDLDAIAAQIRILSDQKVPILWRPLHEADGGWFWWGAKGAAPAVALYKLMFEKFTYEHRLNNLIWVWNSIDPEWYPGPDYLDVISADIYLEKRNHAPSDLKFDNLYTLVEGKKIIAMSENGSVPDPDRLVAFDARWSWYCTWVAEFTLTQDYTSNDQLKKTLLHDYVITLDEVPSLPTFR